MRQILSAVTISVVAKAVLGVSAIAGVAGFVLMSTDLAPDPVENSTSDVQAPGDPLSPRTRPSSLSPQVFTETAKLIASDGSANDELGFSVAISGDTAVVGASRDDNDSMVSADDNRGSAYVFVRDGGTGVWAFQQKLLASDGLPGDSFGWSVAIDGNTVVVGAYADDSPGAADRGAAYVFVRTGATWTEQAQLLAADGAANDQFGVSVAISGETIAAGAYGDEANRGAAYAFTRTGTLWTQQARLAAADGAANDEFGASVSIGGDTVIAGAEHQESSRGAAYVFHRSGSSWTQQAKLAAADGAGSRDHFGHAVAIDADTAVIGAVHDSPGGSAYVFVRTGSAWTEQQRLTAVAGAANDKFGGTVGVRGNTAVIGADGDDVPANVDRGSAFVFKRSGGTWSQDQQLFPSDGIDNQGFGGSVAIGTGVILIGAYLTDASPFLDVGAGYIFTEPQPTPTPTATPTPTPQQLASISGVVLGPDGRGLRNTSVTLVAPDETFTTDMVDQFGFYEFFNVPIAPGEYTLRINSKLYRFTSRKISVSGDRTNEDFTGRR